MNQPQLERWQARTPALKLPMDTTTTRLPQTAETSKTPPAGQGENTGWTPQGVRTDSAAHPPMSGKHPAGLAVQNGSGRNSHYPSRTASASYQKRSWLARSTRTSEGNQTPLCQRSLIFRGLKDHADNGHRPAWLRLSVLRK